MKKLDKKRENVPPIVYIVLGIMALWLVPKLGRFMPNFLSSPDSELGDRASLGDRLLIDVSTVPATEAKKRGISQFAQKNYREAARSFQDSLREKPNDPETLIYLNNARTSDIENVRIAVSVPIGTNLNVAQEMLRGVAQAQNQINATGGIKGFPLQVEIINDDNDANIAKQVATELVEDPKILAVIGHNASNASVAAAPIYQKGELPAITPTSFSNALSGFGSYIFRTVPNVQTMATVLANYAVKTARTERVAVCYDSQSPDNLSFKDEFVAAFMSAGGEIVPTVCDVSTPTFNADAALAEAIAKGAQGVLLSPYVDRIDRVINFADANQGKLALYGSHTLYTMQTLESGRQNVNGMVLPVPWHPQAYPNNSFAQQARQQWGGDVNWRTATSFDATQAVVAALQQNLTRRGVRQALQNPTFKAVGAGEDVQFLPTGDRASQPILVEARWQGTASDGFVPLNR